MRAMVSVLAAVDPLVYREVIARSVRERAAPVRPAAPTGPLYAAPSSLVRARSTPVRPLLAQPLAVPLGTPKSSAISA